MITAGKIYISPYTNPKNCTDIFDVTVGIDCAKEAISQYESQGKKVPVWLYGRLSKLHTKKQAYEAKTN